MKRKKTNQCFICCDIETFLREETINGEVKKVQIPYALGSVDSDGKYVNYFNHKGSYKIIERFLKGIFITFIKPSGQIYPSKSAILAYFHNLDFDGNFILDFLLSTDVIQKWIEQFNAEMQFEIRPIIKDQSIVLISLGITYPNKNKEMVFKTILNIHDSFKLLPSSLDDLVKKFVDPNESKIQFEHSKVNSHWLSCKENKKLALKYLKKDCVLLQKVLNVFAEQIHRQFGLSINKHPTLPSLSLAIYLQNFCPNKEFITPCSGNATRFIREAYYGGRVDVFKPAFIKKNTDDYLYCYDVNSLYPSVMKQTLPVGKCYYEERPSDLSKPGFYQAIVETPIDIYIPILPLKYGRTKDTARLFFPIGTFKAIWWHEELLLAVEQGYKIEIINGYIFEKSENMFNEFVDTCYNNRKIAKQSKDKINDQIYKMLLNSLYGRLGMKDYLPQTLIIKNENIPLAVSNLYVLDLIRYKTNTLLSVQLDKPYTLEPDIISRKEREMLHQLIYPFQIKPFISRKSAVHMAAAITAKARIALARILLKHSKSIYYCDTDSVFLDTPLDESEVSQNELGKWKLEHKIKEAFFFNPKTYVYTNHEGTQTVKAKGSPFKMLDYEHFKRSYFEQNNSDKENDFITLPFFAHKVINSYKLQYIEKLFSKEIKKTTKREVILENNQWVDTKPLQFKYDKDTDSNLLIE